MYFSIGRQLVRVLVTIITMLRLNETLVLLCNYYGELGTVYFRYYYCLFRWLCARNNINRDIEFIILCKKLTHSFFRCFIGKPESNKPDHPDHVLSIFVYQSVELILSEWKKNEKIWGSHEKEVSCSKLQQ